MEAYFQHGGVDLLDADSGSWKLEAAEGRKCVEGQAVHSGYRSGDESDFARQPPGKSLRCRAITTIEISGIQGAVDKVYEAGKFTLVFANLRVDSPSMTSIDTTKFSHGDWSRGVRVYRGTGADPVGAAHRLSGQPGVVCEYSKPK